MNRTQHESSQVHHTCLQKPAPDPWTSTKAHSRTCLQGGSSYPAVRSDLPKQEVGLGARGTRSTQIAGRHDVMAAGLRRPCNSETRARREFPSQVHKCHHARMQQTTNTLHHLIRRYGHDGLEPHGLCGKAVRAPTTKSWSVSHLCTLHLGV